MLQSMMVLVSYYFSINKISRLSSGFGQSASLLSPEDRELVLLRCVNGEPMAVLSKLYGQSRFALRRRLNGILKTLRDALE